MEKYKTVVLKCAIVPRDEKDAAISELSTVVEIQDDGAGPFIVLSQPMSNDGIRINDYEIEYIASEAKRLVDHYKEQSR